jgi:hypothetical protein
VAPRGLPISPLTACPPAAVSVASGRRADKFPRSCSTRSPIPCCSTRTAIPGSQPVRADLSGQDGWQERRRDPAPTGGLRWALVPQFDDHGGEA